MPWVKGQSGNPGGRPKALAAVKAAAQEKGPECIRLLWELSQCADSDAAKIAAIKELLDRGFGRPAQAVEVSGPEGGAIEIDRRVTELSDAALDRLISASAAEGEGAPH